MKTSTIIFLLVILFLIYCFQHRNQISQLIESFTTTPSGNLLPPFTINHKGDDIINVPYQNVVRGSMEVDETDKNIIIHTNNAANSYTNHFMFTPLDKTKFIDQNNNLVQKTYVLSVECYYEAPIGERHSDGSPTGKFSNAEVEIWIFGLNKGRRHYVDQSYQDFKSIIKNIPDRQWTTIELLYQPLSLNTEYVAVRFDNNLYRTRRDNNIATIIKWRNPQLEVYQETLSSGARRRDNCNYATPYSEGPQLYKIDVNEASRQTPGPQGLFVSANALAVNKFGNIDGSNADGYAKVADGDQAPYTMDRILRVDLDSNGRGHNTKTHFINPRINSYFPTLNHRDDLRNSKFNERYIKIDLHLVLQFRQNYTNSTDIREIFKELSKIFTYELYDLTQEDYYNNKSLFGYLQKQYYNNDDRLKITDITIRNEDIPGVDSLNAYRISKLQIGDFKLLGDSNKLYNYFVSGNENITFGESFSVVRNTNDNIVRKNKIILPLNIYYDSPESIDSDLTLLKNDIYSFIKRENMNAISIVNKQINFRTWNDVANTDSRDNFIIHTPQGNKKYFNTISRTQQNCSIYNGESSTCTAMATEVTGVGTQIQECACTRCTRDPNIISTMKTENNFKRRANNRDNNTDILPGFGNPFYFCDRQKRLGCNVHNDMASCNAENGCAYNSSNGNCDSSCDFVFPPHYGAINATPPPRQQHQIIMSELNTYDSHNPIKKHTSILAENSCQIYKTVGSTAISSTKLNMNHFRNCLTRIGSNNKPIDLALSIKYSFGISGGGNNNNIQNRFENFYVSKYRGKYFAWLIEGNTAIPFLYSNNNNNFTFINIDQFNSADSLKNIHLPRDQNTPKYVDPSDGMKTEADSNIPLKTFNDGDSIQLSGVDTLNFKHLGYNETMRSSQDGNSNRYIFDTHYLVKN